MQFSVVEQVLTYVMLPVKTLPGEQRDSQKFLFIGRYELGVCMSKGFQVF